jgi:hypothetical protein
MVNKLSRRSFLALVGGAAVYRSLTGCQRFLPQFDPASILTELRRNEVIGRIRNGRIDLNYHEFFSEKGREALKLIQHGLFALGLIDADPAKFNFGVYGPQTTQAVKDLSAWAGINGDGQKFDQAALQALEKALAAKVDGTLELNR